jgi:uroporphyrin-III C-methyltransferase
MIPTVFTFRKEPQLTLVGAGPGDPGLITVKGVNTLRQADVVLFDALVSKEILDLIPEGIPSFSVGKRSGAHSYSQDQINEMIVEMAYAYGHVARLKGGDSFVFGRGSEEIAFAEAHGLKTAIVPGVSSAIAVPATLSIPVTARGISESFWVVTATTKSGVISPDISLAAQSTGTVVILMGMNKVDEIMEYFKRYGKGETPAAIIQNGTLPNQQSVVGTVSTVASLIKIENIGSPGIIIIGDVVRFAREQNKAIHSGILKNYE